MIKWLPIQDNILEGRTPSGKYFILTKIVEKKREVVSLYSVPENGEKVKFLPSNDEEKSLEGMKILAECHEESRITL